MDEFRIAFDKNYKNFEDRISEIELLTNKIQSVKNKIDNLSSDNDLNRKNLQSTLVESNKGTCY